MEIKIRELCKSYGKKKALQNFDATFENGIYGILGPNGDDNLGTDRLNKINIVNRIIWF